MMAGGAFLPVRHILRQRAAPAKHRTDYMNLRMKILAGALGALAAAAPAFAVRKVVGRIIARINGAIVTNWQYEREKEKLSEQLAQRYSGDELKAQAQLQSKNLLRDLIDQELLVQKAKDDDINVDTDVIKRLDTIRKQMGLETQADLQHEVEKQGIVWEDFEDNIRRNLLMQEVIGREVGSRIIISREDERKYYDAHKDEFKFDEGVRLADIMIANKDRSDEDARKRAEEVETHLKAGDKWQTLVERYSDDQNTSAEGGDLGFFKKGTLAPALAQAIAKLDTNDTSDVIKIPQGYIILKVLARRQAGIAPFEDVEQQVSEKLYNEKLQPALREYLTTLRKQSFISIAPGFFDSGAERPSDMELAQGPEP